MSYLYFYSIFVVLTCLLISCSTGIQPSIASDTLYRYCPLTIQESGAVQPPAAESSPSDPEDRLIVVISDLHMGIGKDSAEKWYNEEDFRWQKEFELFLKEIDREGKGATDLILNGDTFELWQSITNDCQYEDKNLGCTESEALARMRKVIQAHTPDLKALGRFAESHNNRIILLAGNHDVALQFPEVRNAAIGTITTSKDRVIFNPSGYWLSADQRIYVEHGHQIGREVNCFVNWPSPFITEGGKSYLRRPWGEQFVQKYYNDYENKYSILDNIASEQEGVRYGLEAEGPAGTAKAAGNFLKFFLFQVSWDQFYASLGDKGEPAQWDVKLIREQEGDHFIIESLSKGDPFRVAAEKALKEGQLTLSIKDLTDDEIVMLCDKRAALKKMENTHKKTDENDENIITECPRIGSSLGAAAQNVLRSRNAVYGEHLRNTYELLKLKGKVQRHFDIFIYGHTHRRDTGFYPLKGNWNPRVINSGAWQRVVESEQLNQIVKSGNLSSDEVLSKLELEKLPPCYTVVMIKPYQNEPDPRLSYWRKDKQGGWGFSDSCDWQPKVSSK